MGSHGLIIIFAVIIHGLLSLFIRQPNMMIFKRECDLIRFYDLIIDLLIFVLFDG